MLCDLEPRAASEYDREVRTIGRRKDISGKASRSAAQSSGETRWAREDEDVRLMLRFQKGEREAFDELVRRNTSRIYALGYRFLGDANQVEDLAQEVFLRVYRTAPKYRPAARFSTWLYRIVANLSFNILRSRRRGAPLPLNVVMRDTGEFARRELTDARTAAPPDGIDRSELADQVAAAVRDLPDNQRIAIVLSKYENKSYEEIAEMLDCTTMAVKSLLSRARGNLRTVLRGYLDLE